MRKKFIQCVMITHTGIPGSKVGNVGTHGFESMNDWAALVRTNNFSATTATTPNSTTPSSSHHTEMNREPSRKCT